MDGGRIRIFLAFVSSDSKGLMQERGIEKGRERRV